jgi:hypothetical protein
MKPSRIRGLAALATILAVVLTLSACGGSSSPSSTTAAAKVNATGSSGPAGGAPGGATGAAGAARRTALAACLKKYGVTLPAGRVGAGRSRFGASGASGATGRFGATGRAGATGARGRGVFGGGAFAANPKFATALAKCGGAFGARFGAAGRADSATGFNVSSAQDRAEVRSFTACMTSSGVVLPAPNFSGTGSVFGTGVNRTTAAYRTAYAKCQGLLRFLAPAGATGSAGSPAA